MNLKRYIRVHKGQIEHKDNLYGQPWEVVKPAMVITVTGPQGCGKTSIASLIGRCLTREEKYSVHLIDDGVTELHVFARHVPHGLPIFVTTKQG